MLRIILSEERVKILVYEMPKRVTRYKRDLMGNIVSVINALGYEEIFSYDLLGRVTGKKDREGYNTDYSYTEAGDIKN